MIRTLTFCVIFPLLIISCNQNDLGQTPVPENYSAEMEQWEMDRIEDLKEPTGYLRLAGMFWLEEGENSFGSGDDQDIQFPEGSIPDLAGYFVMENEQVTMRVAEDVDITHENEPISEKIIFDGDESLDIQHEFLEWLVIERQGEIAIRLFNKANEKVDNFNGFPRYPLDPALRLKAKFIPNPENTTIPIVNVLGQNAETPSPGKVEFIIDGKRYSVDALAGTTRLFLIIGDETNQTETYQAGRYMYIDYPEEGSDYTVIDFNKIYNPPCAYSLFTTCQLPPPNNRLDVAIEAGEKRPVDWKGL
ncbi:MAG: DUF1684 domain-containing protein [Balneolaceae bacterium]